MVVFFQFGYGPEDSDTISPERMPYDQMFLRKFWRLSDVKTGVIEINEDKIDFKEIHFIQRELGIKCNIENAINDFTSNNGRMIWIEKKYLLRRSP